MKYDYIFITGSIGSGKSTFCEHLKTMLDPEYFEVIDLDKVGKQIVEKLHIEIPDKNDLFKDQLKLFELEQLVWSNLNLVFTNKTRVIEVSTYFECPVIENKKSCVINITCNDSIKHADNRDKIDRANLVMKSQLSKELKDIAADYIIRNNSTADHLSLKAYLFAKSLTHQCTEQFIDDINYLKEQWSLYLDDLPMELCDNVLKEYTRLDRHYHNHSHLVYMFKNFNKLIKMTPFLEYSKLAKKAMALAIFYHDVKMHFTYAETNFEEQSVRFLIRQFKQYNLTHKAVVNYRSYLFIAVDLILATRTHTIPTDSFIGSAYFIEYTKLFLDLDVLVLSDINEFDKYCLNIKCEYSDAPTEVYNKARIAVLSKLSNKQVYKSGTYDFLNKTAQTLISNEIKKLK